MANKMVFVLSQERQVKEELIEYKYYSGFALCQRQKCIKSLHGAIQEAYPDANILEISSKSIQPEGVRLSAFNLKFYHRELERLVNIENVFQSAKVFEKGGPYADLLNVSPREAKQDHRLSSSGKLIAFELYGRRWSLNPSTMFYDWLYLNALNNDSELCEALRKYTAFTDIEFNHKRSLNCQARSAAMYVSLWKKGLLEKALNNTEFFANQYEEQTRFI